VWPDIVEAVKHRRRLAWIQLSQHAQVTGLAGNVLTVGFNNAGARESFVNSGCDQVLRQAAIDVLGADWRIDAIVDPGARSDAPPPREAPAPVQREAQPAADAWPGHDQSSSAPQQDWSAPEASAPAALEQPQASASPAASRQAREAIQQTRNGPLETEPTPPEADPDLHAHPDDIDAEHVEVSVDELLAQGLGATVIEEIRHNP
jgi:DNA polymerase-3 subunit gamma/tau